MKAPVNMGCSHCKYKYVKASHKYIASRVQMVFFPFVILLTFLILGFSFLNWIIFIKSKTFIAYPYWLYVGLPAVVSTVVVFGVLRPRCHHLMFVLDRKRSLIWFQLIAISLFTTVIYLSQILLEDSLTTIVNLPDIADIYHQQKSKFFSVKDYSVKKNLYGYSFSCEKSYYKNSVSFR